MRIVTLSICLLLIFGCGEQKSSSETTQKSETTKKDEITEIDICNHQERQVLPMAIQLWKQNYGYLQNQLSGNSNSASTFNFQYESFSHIYTADKACNLMEVVYYMGDHVDASGATVHCPMVALGSVYEENNTSVSSEFLITPDLDEEGKNILISRTDIQSGMQEWQTYCNSHSDVLLWVQSYTYKWETVLNNILQVPPGGAATEGLSLQIDMVAHSVSPYSVMYQLPADNGNLVEGYYAFDILARRNDGQPPALSNSHYDFAAPCPPYCGKKE